MRMCAEADFMHKRALMLINKTVNLGMATLTVQIDKKKDLPALQAILQKLGLEYEVEEDEDWRTG